MSNLIGKVPIIGYLVYCERAQHVAAAKDFFIGLCFSTATFWLSALFLSSLEANKDSNYLLLLQSTVRNGELFIFTVGFLGPILLTALEDPKNARPFPGRIWHILALVVVAIIAAGFFALMKVATNRDITPIFNRQFIYQTSLHLAGLSIALRYLAIVYRKQTIDPEKEIKEKEANFANEFAKHREGK